MSPGNIRGKWKQEKCGTLISATIRNPLKMLKFPTILHTLLTGQNLQENICNIKIRKKPLFHLFHEKTGRRGVYFVDGLSFVGKSANV